MLTLPILEASAIVECALEPFRVGIFVLPGRCEEGIAGDIHEPIRINPHSNDVERRRGPVNADSQREVF